MWPFSDFQYGFRSSRSTADFLTVMSDRIARPFNRSRATRPVALDISKANTGAIDVKIDGSVVEEMHLLRC